MHALFYFLEDQQGRKESQTIDGQGEYPEYPLVGTGSA